MKNYNEVAADVLLRRDKYNEKKKTRRKRALQLSAVAVCFAYFTNNDTDNGTITGNMATITFNISVCE